MNVSGTTSWTVNVPESYIVVSAKYVLRLMLPATHYDPTAAQISSPGFIVTAAASSGSNSSAAAPTDVAVGLSAGAKAGIGVGVSLGVIGIGALIAVLFLLPRRKDKAVAPARDEK
jgi:hypothetical protein